MEKSLVPRRTTAAIPPEHLRTDVIQCKTKRFDNEIGQKLGDSMNKSKIKTNWPEWTPYDDDDENFNHGLSQKMTFRWITSMSLLQML